MDIKCVIFDLDGTLVDTIEDLTDSMNYALEKLGMPTHTPQQCMAMIGYGKKQFVESALPQGQAHLSNQLLSLAWDYYWQNCCVKTRKYDQIQQIIGKLLEKGIKLAVLTNKDQPTAQKMVDYYFDSQVFEQVIGEINSVQPKPGPEVILKMVNEMGFNPKEVILVGDSEADIKTGKNANIYTVAVSWGFRNRQELERCEPDCLIDRPISLLDLLKIDY